MPWDDYADEQYCYLTTTGRISGEPREIEIWFGVAHANLYMLSGSGADDGRPRAHWVRNLLKAPAVTVRVAGHTFPGRARLVERGTEEDALARRLLVAKYQPGYANDLSGWGRTALPVAVELLTP
jgi:deazaflavin-dependent oxidoreductase (nitroreductase family)